MSPNSELDCDVDTEAAVEGTSVRSGLGLKMRWRVQALLEGLVCGSAGEPGNANDGDSVTLGDMRCNVTKQRKSVANNGSPWFGYSR